MKCEKQFSSSAHCDSCSNCAVPVGEADAPYRFGSFFQDLAVGQSDVPFAEALTAGAAYNFGSFFHDLGISQSVKAQSVSPKVQGRLPRAA